MKAYYEDSHVTIYHGSSRSMAELEDGSIHCVVTSPPYWGLRKYEGEQEVGDWGCAYGLEKTPEEYVDHTIELLREIRRALRDDGVVFWNIGDSYSGSQKGIGTEPRTKKEVFLDVHIPKTHWSMTGIKPKDMCLIPFRVALAAQTDGWWVRSVIIWAKNNPMPESVKDRPTSSYEYILMLTKDARYFWDNEAVREPQTGNAHWRGTESGSAAYQEARGSYYGFRSPITELPNGRNLRDVWTIPTMPFPAELRKDGQHHFAVFPEKVPEICIKAATSEKGCCPKCGAPWVRVIEVDRKAKEEWRVRSGDASRPGPIQTTPGRAHTPENFGVASTTIGWQPSCSCNLEPTPCTVLDPFMGSGTTLMVAKKLGRRAVGYDVSASYCDMAIERCGKQMVMEF